jgi:hypothetical protein|tara:strand:- start:79 stop:276 length:198 start_codon:yes stop_codon:yes gene_type:complete
VRPVYVGTGPITTLCVAAAGAGAEDERAALAEAERYALAMAVQLGVDPAALNLVRLEAALGALET